MRFILGFIGSVFAAILLLFFLPWLDKSPVRSGNYRPLFKRFFWLLVIDVIILGYVGGAPIVWWRTALGQVAAAYYFLHFLVILPLVSAFETTDPLPNSISESVLSGDAAETPVAVAG